MNTSPNRAICLIVIVLGLTQGAQSGPPIPEESKSATTTIPSAADLKRLVLLEQQLNASIDKKDWDAAAANCREQIKILPERADAYYNLACALARSEKAEESLDALTDAIERGFAEPAHMRNDPDLESLRTKGAFKALLMLARENEVKAPYDKGEPIEGIRTYEAFPEGGLRYRLRYDPKATKSHPNKLIIWLHPSGGSMNHEVEKLAPEMVKHGYAIMVITRKQFVGWTDEEFTELREKTLPHVDTVPMVDSRRPILMGFSAGGQMAINAWAKDPGAWGGLILDAAYPLDVEAYMRGKIVPMPLPLKDEIKECPIYTIVGGADKGLQMWRELAPHWIEAGVPLSVRTVEGKGHTWLLDAEHWPDVARWLDEVKAGKLPTDPAK